jgi:hypothetical protein
VHAVAAAAAAAAGRSHCHNHQKTRDEASTRPLQRNCACCLSSARLLRSLTAVSPTAHQQATVARRYRRILLQITFRPPHASAYVQC